MRANPVGIPVTLEQQRDSPADALNRFVFDKYSARLVSAARVSRKPPPRSTATGLPKALASDDAVRAAGLARTAHAHHHPALREDQPDYAVEGLHRRGLLRPQRPHHRGLDRPRRRYRRRGRHRPALAALRPRARLVQRQLLRAVPAPDGLRPVRLLHPKGSTKGPVARSQGQPAEDPGRHPAHRRRAGGRRRRVRPSLTDADGHRFTAFLTDTRGGQLADLEVRHRSHARVEDRIRTGKATGLRNLPCKGYDQNRVWLELSLAAADLLNWAQALCFDDALARCEPAAIRYPRRPRRRHGWCAPAAAGGCAWTETGLGRAPELLTWRVRS